LIRLAPFHCMFRRVYQLVYTTIEIWSETNVSRNSAAMTYYAMLSLAPLLLISIALAGLFFCNQQVELEIYAYFHDMASPEVAQTIASLLANTTSTNNTLFASLISMVIMLYGASGVFTQLFDTFNDIWKVPQQRRMGIRFTARKRILGICMVLMVGTLLIGSLALGAVMAYLSQLLDGNYPRLSSWLALIDRGLSFFLLPFVLSLMFWYLPMKKIRWPDVWPAAGLTAGMLAGSRYMIDFYLRLSTAGEVYGAAGSLVLLLVWVYLTGQVIFFGACLSCAWTQHLGSGVASIVRQTGSDKAAEQDLPAADGWRKRVKVLPAYKAIASYFSSESNQKSIAQDTGRSGIEPAMGLVNQIEDECEMSCSPYQHHDFQPLSPTGFEESCPEEDRGDGRSGRALADDLAGASPVAFGIYQAPPDAPSPPLIRRRQLPYRPAA